MAIIIQFPTQQTSKALPVPPAKSPEAAPTPRTSADSQRKAMLAKIHMAKAHCMQTLPGFDEDMYRHILQDKYGVSSAAELNYQQLHRLLLHFAGLGFEAKKGRHRKQAPATLTHDSANMGREALMQKIEAQLTEKGSAEGTEMPWAYAVAILKKQSGGVTKAFVHATPEQLNAVIAALYRDAKRKALSPAILHGAIVDGVSATAAGWTPITDGSFAITINGTETSITGLDFSGVTNLNGVASIISTGLTSHGAACRFDGERFTLSTSTAGATATLGYATAVKGSDSDEGGTDISALLHWTADTALAPIDGSDGESTKECIAYLADRGDWYGCVFTDPLTLEQHLEVAGYIEAASKSRIYGITATDTRTLDAAYTEDIASRLKALKRKRTMVAFSRNPYAVVSALGRAFVVNFSANRSTITLKFKQLPGVVAEGLSESQAVALTAKRCNVFAAYNNDTSIYQEGVMSGDAYFDEIHGTDWLQNAVQNEVWNLLYQSKTKIPQTNAGVNQIVNVIEGVMNEAVNNALVAPGVWNADGFGQIERGDYLPKGYYLYTMPMELQPQSEREQRKAPPIQCAIKLAGAIHFVDVMIDVNR